MFFPLSRFDGMLKADEEYYAKNGEPLFSSHMLDLSEEKDGENIATCVKVRGKRGVCLLFFLLPVGLSGTTVLWPQLCLLQGSPCHSLTLGGVWGWIWAPNWLKVGGAAPGFEPRTSCMRVRSASHYATGAAPKLCLLIIFFVLYFRSRNAFETLAPLLFDMIMCIIYFFYFYVQMQVFSFIL